MRTTLVAGNWKMNGARVASRALVQSICEGLSGVTSDVPPCDVAICPPMALLDTVNASLGDAGATLGAQNVSEHESGAFTGETSAAMLVEAGCTYVIVGHSERRSLYGEDAACVARKYMAAQAASLIPIICVGESLEEREQGRTEAVVWHQLEAVIAAAGVASLKRAVLAYEPVWAIGTGKTASPAQAQAVHAFLRSKVAEADGDVAQGLRILYGGSVKGANAAELFGCEDIDGGLIGGAALDAQDFLAICRAGSH
jgi:triosephosphate isomerase (TIM)